MAEERFHNSLMVATPGAIQLIAGAGADPGELLARHFAGDWGMSHPDDCKLNERVLKSGFGVVMSVFEVGGKKLWVHSYIGGEEPYTTILLPSEY